MKKNLIKINLLFLSLLFACGPGMNEKETMEKYMSQHTSLTDSIGGSSFAQNRKFMRTAELALKVKNVRSSTFMIEQTAANFGGFVLLSEQNSNTEFTNTSIVSADSSEQISSYQLVADLRLRVPESELDSALRAIEKQGIFIDKRIVKAKEANAQLLQEKLTQNRSSNSAKRLQTLETKQGNKLKDALVAEDKLSEKEEIADQSLIKQMLTLDKIAYSTIDIHLYQNPIVRKEMFLTYKPSSPYESPFFTKISESLKWGLHLVEVITLALLKLWPFILLSIAFYYFLRKTRFKLP